MHRLFWMLLRTLVRVVCSFYCIYISKWAVFVLNVRVLCYCAAKLVMVEITLWACIPWVECSACVTVVRLLNYWVVRELWRVFEFNDGGKCANPKGHSHGDVNIIRVVSVRWFVIIKFLVWLEHNLLTSYNFHSIKPNCPAIWLEDISSICTNTQFMQRRRQGFKNGGAQIYSARSAEKFFLRPPHFIAMPPHFFRKEEHYNKNGGTSLHKNKE